MKKLYFLVVFFIALCIGLFFPSKTLAQATCTIDAPQLITQGEEATLTIKGDRFPSGYSVKLQIAIGGGILEDITTKNYDEKGTSFTIGKIYTARSSLRETINFIANIFTPLADIQPIQCFGSSRIVPNNITPTPGTPTKACWSLRYGECVDVCNDPGQIGIYETQSQCQTFVYSDAEKETGYLPQCAQWVYFYDKNHKNYQLNGTPIPKGQVYSDPNFKDRKCTAVDTAIGRISTDPQAFVRSIFSLVLGLAGGIALILIMIAGYGLINSRGDPEKIVAARERLTSAIIGLLFIIFSFVILQVIGVDILHIPGFGE